MRDVRRRREMEENRARAGGVVVQAGAAPSPAGSSDAADRLAQAKRLLDQGLISQDEYRATKQRVLGEL